MAYRLVVMVALLTGCGAGDGGDPSTDVNCEMDPRVDTYTSNMSRASLRSDVQITLVSSDPAPPAMGNNTWRVRVTNQAGDPISNAQLDVQSFMPDHGHGTSVQPEITPGDDGIYDLVPMNLFMPGVWRVTLGNVTGNGNQDSVDFFFCIAG